MLAFLMQTTFIHPRILLRNCIPDVWSVCEFSLPYTTSKSKVLCKRTECVSNVEFCLNAFASTPLDVLFICTIKLINFIDVICIVFRYDTTANILKVRMLLQGLITYFLFESSLFPGQLVFLFSPILQKTELQCL